MKCSRMGLVLPAFLIVAAVSAAQNAQLPDLQSSNAPIKVSGDEQVNNALLRQGTFTGVFQIHLSCAFGTTDLAPSGAVYITSSLAGDAYSPIAISTVDILQINTVGKAGPQICILAKATEKTSGSVGTLWLLISPIETRGGRYRVHVAYVYQDNHGKLISSGNGVTKGSGISISL